MTPEISSALSLMATGMITVFVVLTLVVGLGNVLIRLVNRLPETEVALATQPAKNEISKEKIAVLSAAVDHITMGKGRITKIEKQQE